jgi:hypothetical protein
METCFKQGETFDTFTRVLQSVFKPYMNERVSGYRPIFEYRESSFYANSIYAVSLIRDFTPKKYFYTGCSITRWRLQDG